MVNIIQGGKKDFWVRITDLGSPDGDPLDLTNITQATTCLLNDDASELIITMTGGSITVRGNPILGKLNVSITSAQAAALAVADGKTIEFAIDLGAGPIKVQIENAYSVIKSVC